MGYFGSSPISLFLCGSDVASEIRGTPLEAGRASEPESYRHSTRTVFPTKRMVSFQRQINNSTKKCQICARQQSQHNGTWWHMMLMMVMVMVDDGDNGDDADAGNRDSDNDDGDVLVMF